MLHTSETLSPETEPNRPRPRTARFDFSPWTELPPLAGLVASEPAPPGDRPRGLERLAALAALVLASPVLALIALAIKIDSPRGSIFYRQERVGVDRRRRGGPSLPHAEPWPGELERRWRPGTGHPFLIWKFRTMVPDAEAASGPVWAADKDPRVTRVGRLLRNLRLDEVPQLINVVLGHMRLIGPRPERPQFVQQLARAMPDYPRRHSVPPGITGLAQVEREYDASLDDVRTKLMYDLFYVDNRCWMLDLKILLKTVAVVLRGRGAR